MPEDWKSAAVTAVSERLPVLLTLLGFILICLGSAAAFSSTNSSRQCHPQEGRRMRYQCFQSLPCPHAEHRFLVSQRVVPKRPRGSSFAAKGALSNVDQRT
jgi:hypothetical protein